MSADGDLKRGALLVAIAAFPLLSSAATTTLAGTRGGPPCENEPAWQPPGFVFAVAWTLLYALLGAAMAVCASAGAFGHLANLASLTLALNLWWLAFGTACRPGAALVAIVALLAWTAATAFALLSVRRSAALCVVPLVAWLAFASVLSVQLVSANAAAED